MKTKADYCEWLLGVLILTWPVHARYGGGTGEPNDPYRIYMPEQMNEMGLHEEDWHKPLVLCRRLVRDTISDMRSISSSAGPRRTGERG
ncbi:MAG: hypothetical protein ACYS0H_25120 [Planctomycetota bacterium]|jgi:hypothetical protein